MKYAIEITPLSPRWTEMVVDDYEEALEQQRRLLRTMRNISVVIEEIED